MTTTKTPQTAIEKQAPGWTNKMRGTECEEQVWAYKTLVTACPVRSHTAAQQTFLGFPGGPSRKTWISLMQTWNGLFDNREIPYFTMRKFE
jgi:hypothetical protein